MIAAVLLWSLSLAAVAYPQEIRNGTQAGGYSDGKVVNFLLNKQRNREWEFYMDSVLWWEKGQKADVSPRRAEYIKPCRRHDPNLDQCVATSIQHLAKYLVTGIPELGVPSIEPLIVPRIQIENGVGRIRVKAVFSNMTIHGAGNHTLTNVRTNILDYKIDIAAKIPKVIITGRYEVSGNVLLLNIRSKGDFWASFDEISGNAKLQGSEIFNEERVKFMKIDKVGIDYKVGKARFKIRDRIANNRILGEAINAFLNENWREVLDEMKFSASSAMGKYIKQIINPALLRIPVNVWLVED